MPIYNHEPLDLELVRLAMPHDLGALQRAKGDANRERVKAWFRDHLCGTHRECAQDVGLTEYAVGRHAKMIRSEWLDMGLEALDNRQRKKTKDK